MVEIWMMLGGGLLAGAVGGLLGLGGGILLMPLLRFGVGLPPAQAAGTCVLAVFFTTLGGSYQHLRRRHVRLRPLVPVVVAGAAGAVVASLAFVRLAARDRWLDAGIGVVFLLVAARMLVEAMARPSGPSTETDPPAGLGGSLPAKATIGAAAGVLPGLFGIGTGGILVPAFTFLLKAPVKAAIGASLVCFCLNALISAAFKLGQGYIDLELALPACIGTLIGSNLGAMLNRRTPTRSLQLVFGLVFCCVSLEFLLAMR